MSARLHTHRPRGTIHMTARMRQAYDLVRGEGLGVAEAAERLNCSPLTVKSYLREAEEAIADARNRNTLP